jgi:D-alanyl-D-alanine carboxypeptidase (penicillin-binding protein 5/6)
MSVNTDKYNKRYKDRLIQRIETEVSDAKKSKKEPSKKNLGWKRVRSIFKNIKLDDVSKLVFYGSVIILGIVLLLIFSGFKYLGSEMKILGTSYVGPVKKGKQVNSNVIVSDNTIPLFKKVSDSSKPDIHAESYIAVFAEGFQVVVEDNTDEHLPFASIVKLLGVLVSLDYYDMDDELALLEPVDDLGNGLDLEVGETLSFREILGAVIVGSKNDAMYILYQNYPGNGEKFIAEMNDLADQLGMNDTNVVNPVGLDSAGQVSTPRDLAILGIVAMKNDVISDYAGRTYYDVTTSIGREERVWATNYLVGRLEGVIGLKTGYTEGAGSCLISYVDDNYDFVTVVLNAEDRFEETEKLVNWVRENY